MKQFIKENKEAAEKVVIIMSAERSNLHHTENMLRTKLFTKTLDAMGVPYTKALGCYKGVSEESFVITPEAIDQIGTLINLGLYKLSQECILVRDSKGVHLVYIDGCIKIGYKLQAVTEDTAKVEDAYTIVNGRYFIVK